MHSSPESLNRAHRLLRQVLRPAVLAAEVPCAIDATPEWFEPPDPAAARRAPREPFTVGGRWGRPWHTRWFRVAGAVPDDWPSVPGTEVVAHVDLGFGNRLPGFQAEGLVFRDRRPVQAVQPDRRVVPLPDVVPGGEVELWVEAVAVPMLLGDFTPTALGDPATAPEAPLYTLRAASLARRDTTVAALVVEVELLLDFVGTLPESEPFRPRVVHALEQLVAAIDPADVAGTAAAGRTALAPVFAAPGHPGRHRLVATGHAHLDTAWLWPVREARRKVVRTAVNALGLMERHPGFRFTMSQAQHYAWLATDQPEVFAAVRARVAEGRWEPAGGMWVESDLNLPDGESLVRQFLHGQQAFTAWFGRPCDGAFLPDDFGYPASFPQIARLAGCRWFFTQKMSWNDTNRFPHHTFRWRGIDGSELLAHFSPIETYNATLLPHELLHAEFRFADHAVQDTSLVCFGHGDGGGGPTDEMLARAALQADWRGTAAVELGTVSGFFDRIAAGPASGGDALPTWVGELYLEKHRGTSSSQRRTKQGNRTCERLLHEAALWSVTVGRDERDRLGDLWRRVLTQQFHDVLPGSAIAWARADAEDELAAVAAEAEAVVGELIGGDQGGPAAVANPAPVGVAGVVDLRGTAAWVELPPGAWAPSPGATSLPPDVAPVVTSGSSFDNGRVRLAWDEQGHVVSLLHHATGRDVVPPGVRANVLVLRSDRPAMWDAWDIDEPDTRGPGEPVLDADAVEVVERGPLRAVLRVTRHAGASRFLQTLTLTAGSERVEAAVEVDWQESERRLQVVWPVDVQATEAVCGIQFGHVRRPRHANTPWDWARFEVVAHRYVHVGEHDFGVALLADGPHGYDVRGDALRLTLLRAPRFPDPDADRGDQRLAYALWAHAGDPFRAGLEAEAHRRAHPVRMVPAAAAAEGQGPAWEGEGVLVAAVKHAEDGSGDVVVRLWEAHCGRARGTLHPGRPVAAAALADLLERPTREITVGADGTVALELRPFQILTVRLTPA